jgi:hypothetical protein
VSRVFVALVFCFCTSAMYGQKTRMSQAPQHATPTDIYPIKVHISGLHYRVEGVAEVVFADAVVDGKKLELYGGQRSHFLTFYKLPLGDYQARLIKDPHKPYKVDGTPMYQQYELVLPDNAIWRCTVTGFLE